jgi:hypothetical protein
VSAVSPLEELHHWLGVLRLDLDREVESRHLLSTSRLCMLLIERIHAADPERPETLVSEQLERLEAELTELQHAIVRRVQRRKVQPQRSSWQPRVIHGGTKEKHGKG